MYLSDIDAEDREARATVVDAHHLLLVAVVEPGLLNEAIVEVIGEVGAGLSPGLVLALRVAVISHWDAIHLASVIEVVLLQSAGRSDLYSSTYSKLI